MSDEKPTEETPPKDPKWERRENFRLNQSMEKVLRLALKASEAEAEELRRKLSRLTYGS